jgi:DNA-binding transcriptional MerR regulator
MQIGEVAERTGLTQRTLRYYEAIGLLAPATRMEGGFRLYTEEDIRRLEQIVQLKRLLGFSLAEIRQIVEADETLRQIRQENKSKPDPYERRSRLERAAEILESQLATVQSRIESMRELQASYERRFARVRERLADLDSRLAGGGTVAEAAGVAREPAAVG